MELNDVIWRTRSAFRGALPPVWKPGTEIFYFDFPRPYTAEQLPVSLGFHLSLSTNHYHTGAASFLTGLIDNVESLIDDIYRGAKVQGSLIF